VSFLSKKYDDVLGQYDHVAERLSHQCGIIEGIKMMTYMSPEKLRLSSKQKSWLNTYAVIVFKALE